MSAEFRPESISDSDAIGSALDRLKYARQILIEASDYYYQLPLSSSDLSREIGNNSTLKRLVVATAIASIDFAKAADVIVDKVGDPKEKLVLLRAVYQEESDAKVEAFSQGGEIDFAFPDSHVAETFSTIQGDRHSYDLDDGDWLDFAHELAEANNRDLEDGIDALIEAA